MLFFSLHNVEEAIFGLPAWMVEHWSNGRQIDAATFHLALVLITVLAWLVYLWFRAGQRVPVRFWVAGLVASVLLTNSLGHIGYSIITHSLMPGVLSASLLMGPVSMVVFVHCTQRLTLSVSYRLLFFAGGVVLHFALILTVVSLAGIAVDENLLPAR